MQNYFRKVTKRSESRIKLVRGQSTYIKSDKDAQIYDISQNTYNLIKRMEIGNLSEY